MSSSGNGIHHSQSYLIAGCGWVGEALGSALAARGDTVWGLRRRAVDLPPAIRPIEADLSDPSTLSALPAPLDAVVFAAAPEAGDPASYLRVYDEGLANLLEAVRSAAADGRRATSGAGSRGPRVVLLSSTSVYGQKAGEWVDETSLTAPTDFRGETVLRAEEVLRGCGLPAIALRLGGLYGPGRASLIEAVRSGRATAVTGPPRFTNRIHRDDAVGAIVHLLGLPGKEIDGVYLGVDHEPADRDEVVRWLAERLGVSASWEALPAGGRREPGSRAETSKRCSSARLRASGYRFRYPSYREGYAALLAGAAAAP